MMEKRVFGRHTVSQLLDLRRNPPDGGAYYLALQGAAVDFFILAEEYEKLTGAVQKLMAAAESVVSESHAPPIPTGLKPALDNLSQVVVAPALKKLSTP